MAALLAAPTIRLLTLTGPGGTGKTRLALAVAERVRPTFSDGVVFVSLAPLSDPALVASAIAERLGVRERADQTLHDALVTHLAGKRLLLVLDNCEHVLPAAPLVAELLGACSALRVLTTQPGAAAPLGGHLYPVPRWRCLQPALCHPSRTRAKPRRCACLSIACVPANPTSP